MALSLVPMPPRLPPASRPPRLVQLQRQRQQPWHRLRSRLRLRLKAFRQSTPMSASLVVLPRPCG
eukprot:8349770-Alexandrium_andersonii.AAC.1